LFFSKPLGAARGPARPFRTRRNFFLCPPVHFSARLMLKQEKRAGAAGVMKITETQILVKTKLFFRMTRIIRNDTS
jgi:hypothetical protein